MNVLLLDRRTRDRPATRSRPLEIFMRERARLPAQLSSLSLAEAAGGGDVDGG